MSKSKKTPTRSNKPTPQNKSERQKFSMPVLIIGGLVLLVVLAFVSTFAFDLFKSAKDTRDKNSKAPATASTPLKDPVQESVAAEPVNMSDLSKAIPGSWYETDQVIDGKSAAKSGTLAKASWLFYNDGSLKYTTKDFADMGTWTAKENKFNVTLYASGKREGYISDITNKSMVWVSEEMNQGKKVTVTHHLTKKK